MKDFICVKHRLSIEMNSKEKVLTLPRVEHPSKRINSIDQQQLDIRGKSTTNPTFSSSSSSNDQQLIRNEFLNDQRFSRLSSRRKSNLSRKSSSTTTSERIRLPIFGYSNGGDRRQSSLRKENARTMLTTNEYLEILRDKVEKDRREIQRKFRQLSNGNRNGRISRQAFRHLISSIFGVQFDLNGEEIDSIVKRFHLKDEQQINCDEFLSQLNLLPMKIIDRIVEESSRSSSPNSFTSIDDEQQRFDRPTAEQMFQILKDKIQSKSDDLIEYFPSLINSNSNDSKAKVYRNEFRQNLIRLGFHFDDYQFNRLWKRFDPDGFHSIDLEKILHLIRNEEFQLEIRRSKVLTSETQDQQKSILHQQFSRHSNSSIPTPRLTTAENDLTTKQIQLWILHKFPQGFSDLEKSLIKFDEKQNGFIRREEFIGVFRSFGFDLDENHLERFLHRLNLRLTKDQNKFIDYRNVLRALKEKHLSTNSIDKQMKTISTSDESFEKSLFGQIEYLIRTNFHRIENELNHLDLSSKGILSSDQWKEFIEKLIEFPLNPNEYFLLKKSFPQDQQGNIRWKHFIQQIQNKSFSTNQMNKSIDLTTSKIPSWDYMRSKNIRERLDLQHFDKQKSTKSNSFDRSTIETTNQKSLRSFEQLHQLLKKLIRDRYKDIEEEFQKLDQSSYGELTKDLLFQLFRRLSVQPEVNRSEIDLIWCRCHLKENGNLDFYQFLREFGYSKRSAHYPNAKQNPPKRGDADFLLTSRKLYGDSVLVHGTALNAIRSNWNELRREFGQLDPYRTGFIQSDEFDDILIELCPSVNQEDLDILREKFQTKTDSRTNYIRFLKYHSPLTNLRDEIGSIDEQSNRKISLDQFKRKIRSKLIDKEKSVRRKFRENDQNNSGKISVGKLKKILDENHCHFNDQEFSFLLSQFQQSIDGFIYYQQFIETFIQ